MNNKIGFEDIKEKASAIKNSLEEAILNHPGVTTSPALIIGVVTAYNTAIYSAEIGCSYGPLGEVGGALAGAAAGFAFGCYGSLAAIASVVAVIDAGSSSRDYRGL